MARRRCAAEDLVFRVNYLGGEIPTFALNFSRPGSQVIAQYYNFLRLGRDGYRAVQQGCQDVALRLSTRIAELGPFELLTDGSELPVFAFKLRDDITNYTVFEVSRALRGYGWQVPAYTLPANLQDVSRSSASSCASFNADMADILLGHLERAVVDDLSRAADAAAHLAGPRRSTTERVRGEVDTETDGR